MKSAEILRQILRQLLRRATSLLVLVAVHMLPVTPLLDAQSRPFRRGDANGDGHTDFGDAVFLQFVLFCAARTFPCVAAADVDGDSRLEIVDVLALMNWFVSGGPPPPPPGPYDCGSVDGGPDCQRYDFCGPRNHVGDSRLELTCEVPEIVQGAAGSLADIPATVWLRVPTAAAAPRDEVFGGWMLSIKATGCRITAASTGTVTANGTGLVDVVSLACSPWPDEEMLPILELSLEATIPEGGATCELEFLDGQRAAGEPHENVVFVNTRRSDPRPEPDRPPEPDLRSVRRPRSVPASVRLESAGTAVTFRRCDADTRDDVELTDAIVLLFFLFLGGEALDCDDAADCNDDGALDSSDALAILAALFLGEPVALPGVNDCGADPTVDALGCGQYERCP